MNTKVVCLVTVFLFANFSTGNVILETTFSAMNFVEDSVEMVSVKGRIPVLYENAVRYLSNVRKLQFNNNDIQEIRPGAFKNFTQVEILEIRNSNLETIRKNIFNDLKVKHLVLSNNRKLKHFEEHALDNEHIEFLILQNNSIEFSNVKCFKKIPKLKVLDLSYNQIKVLQTDSFAGLKIQVLDVSGNQIEKLPGDLLKSMESLERFSMLENDLTKINNDTFKSHPNLVELDLSHNHISEISRDSFDDMPKLKIVNLAFNEISKIDPWFYRTPNLHTLNLFQNSINFLPNSVFINLSKNRLKKLQLGNNNLTKISDDSFRGLTWIKNLELVNCSIKFWNATFLKDTEYIGELDLIDNKIICPEGDLSQVFKAEITFLLLNPLSSQCLENIRFWQMFEDLKKHKICHHLVCDV